ncbi:HD-GYP domain-containing protein [Neorhodopirellula pilleata]|uniref:Cyclic di-GMP phosphodiesterase response regulator RpfG n=1 Tax=Neorhodopirellula pilleata TaxID=2714738 RepID=A0A5C5ZM36_9BACT|nr:HD domain-containing phosphohydrolase [Neorhodopirellula pilleata]TWT87901.1 Cyclic di-GMP phosphodiesterase response regulator RpfG [Neorhodopirellula pilleata]
MFVNELIAISVSTISPTASIGADLYCRIDNSDRAQLYRGADYPMKPEDLNRLRSRGVHQLFIERESRARYQDYLRELAQGGGDESASGEHRAAALNEVVLDVLESSFKKKDTNDSIDAASQLGAIAANLVTRSDFAAGDLFRVLHHDYATFTHSANVAYYCGILATELGYAKSDVETIIAGGLLHDLGKLEIPDAILCKPGRLDEDEFNAVKRHPKTGFLQLCHREDICEGQLMMVYQHHERLDGNGYPVGITGDEIHPWGKLCAVVDIYEAVTSQRPYRTPMTRQQAIDLLRRESGKALEMEVVECWISIIQATMPT